MLVLVDIDYLHLSSLEETIDIFLPSAKIFHIFYGCRWSGLLYEPMPIGIDVFWTSMDIKNSNIFLEECIQNALKVDAQDEIIVVDPAYSFGKKILHTYINEYTPSKLYN
jgi:hypothetical protein